MFEWADEPVAVNPHDRLKRLADDARLAGRGLGLDGRSAFQVNARIFPRKKLRNDASREGQRHAHEMGNRNQPHRRYGLRGGSFLDHQRRVAPAA